MLRGLHRALCVGQQYVPQAAGQASCGDRFSERLLATGKCCRIVRQISFRRVM